MEEREQKSLFEQFFLSIKKLPDVVQAKGSADEYRWFKFGELLYEIVTTTCLAEQDPLRPDGASAMIAALEAQIPMMNLSAPLLQNVENFVQLARKRPGLSVLLNTANQIATTIYSFL
jgi:hypothetical protein